MGRAVGLSVVQNTTDWQLAVLTGSQLRVQLPLMQPLHLWPRLMLPPTSPRRPPLAFWRSSQYLMQLVVDLLLQCAPMPLVLPLPAPLPMPLMPQLPRYWCPHRRCRCSTHQQSPLSSPPADHRS